MRRRAIEFDDDFVASPEPLELLSDHVAAMAIVVRTVYCNAVRMTGHANLRNYGARAVSGDDRENVRGEPKRTAWERLAQHLLTIGAPPELFIKAQFEAHRKCPEDRSLFPPVRKLYTDWATANWLRFDEGRPQAIAWQLQSDRAQLNVNVLPMVVNLGWSEYAAVEYALGDSLGCVITPLTRYCTAFQYGVQRIAERSFKAALFQYIFERQYYDNVLGNGVPEPLREAAREIRISLGLELQRF